MTITNSEKSRLLKKAYKEKMKLIKPFVSFKVDLRKNPSKSQKTKINKYFNEIKAVTKSRVTYVYKPRNKENLKSAQMAAHEKYLPGLKVAFIPAPDSKTIPDIKFDKSGNMSVKYGNISEKYIEFRDMDKLINDPINYVNRLIKKYPDIKHYKIKAGLYEITGQRYAPSKIGEGVAHYTAKYDLYTEEGEKDNHHYSNWLNGVTGYSFENQADYKEYQKRKKAANRYKRKISKLKKG